MSIRQRTIQTLAIGALAGAGALISAPAAQASPGCPADMAPLPNGDLVVNTQDLLAVIGAWGACPGCPTDIAPAVLDGVVNTQDLLAVIGAWGACPPQGPVNNECAGAITVVNGPNAYNNTGATQSLPLPAADACIFGGPANITRDVWFTYTATCTGSVTIDTCANTGTFTDTVIVAYSACGGTQIGCDDDGCPTTTPDNLLSRLTLPVTTGQVLKLRVGSWGAVAGNQGAGVLTITCTPLNDDFCTDATAVAVGGNVNGNVLLATPETNGPPTCSGGPGVGRWYSVVGNGNTLTASTCGSPAELWESVTSVYCGLNCDDLVCVSGSSTACGPNGLNSSVSWCSAVGQTYLILVGYPFGNPPGAGEGNFNLAITNGAVCNTQVVCFQPPPANDECEGAVTVVTGANNLNNDDATKSTDPGLECAGGGSANAERDIWAVWTATCTGGAIIDTCATPGAVNDTILGVYTGTCANLTEVGCDEDSCVVPPAINDFNSSVAVSVVTGQQYYIRIASFAGSADGPIVLTITCDASIVCGNGILEPGEECDDGNVIANDGCTNCTVDTPTFPCVGASEGFPCRIDGDVALTDPNGGCNSNPPLFGSAITLNTTICGITSTYTNSLGTLSRDTDWYTFTPAVTGNYQIVMFAPAFTPQTGWLQDPVDNNVTACPGAAFIPGSAVGGTAGVPLVSNAVLTAGNTYAVFCARLTTTPPVLVACANGDYSVRITFSPTP